MYPQGQAVPVVELTIYGATPCGVARPVMEVELLAAPANSPAALAAGILIAWRYAVAAGCADLCRCCEPYRWRFTVFLDGRKLGTFNGAGGDDSWRWN